MEKPFGVNFPTKILPLPMAEVVEKPFVCLSESLEDFEKGLVFQQKQKIRKGDALATCKFAQSGPVEFKVPHERPTMIDTQLSTLS